MAEVKVNFADYIKEERERKKRQTLAQQLLGSKKSKTSGAGALPNSRNAALQKPSLVSRMSSNSGVSKSRSSSTKRTTPPIATGPVSTGGSINSKWQHDLHALNNPNGPPKQQRRVQRVASASQIDRNTRTFDKFRAVLQDNVPEATSGGFNIKGVAAEKPSIVIASNFAPGTTAMDIEAVMMPIARQRDGTVISCRLISSNPTVMVELSVDKREAAQNIIDTFNNQRADGRLLYVYLKEVPNAAAIHSRPAPQSRAAPQQSYDDMDVVEQNTWEPKGNANGNGNGNRSFNGSFQDGRYGFSSEATQRRDPPRGPRRRY